MDNYVREKKLNYDMLFTQLGTFFDAFKFPALQKELWMILHKKEEIEYYSVQK